jgi:hypothetical protein
MPKVPKIVVSLRSVFLISVAVWRMGSHKSAKLFNNVPYPSNYSALKNNYIRSR